MKKNTPIPEFPDQYKKELKARIQDDFTTKIAEGVRGVALEVLSVALQDLVRDSDREYMQVRSAAYFLKSTDCNIWYDFLNIEIEDGRAITDKYIKMYVRPGPNAYQRYVQRWRDKRFKAQQEKLARKPPKANRKPPAQIKEKKPRRMSKKALQQLEKFVYCI